MSDNYGPKQSIFLDPTDRSFESVVYLWKKPPLSPEANLVESLSSDQARGVSTSIFPSGWEIIGPKYNNMAENLTMPGDVNTSLNYWTVVGGKKIGNQFKLIAKDHGVETQKLVAWVNGYKVVVQGTNSTDENNIIILPQPPSSGYRIDFVFLEVWRQLITPASVVYKHGNVLYGGTNPANDLVIPVIGMETSLRVQIQYRIRVSPIANLQFYPEGFDPSTVFAQGPNSVPLNCTLANFQKSPSDPGLYVAGLGDTASQTTLGSVDGFIYGIPMFLVTRRNILPYSPVLRSNGAGRTLQDYLNGNPSDRPDNLFNDLIVPEDISDVRHLVMPAYNFKSMADIAFTKLIGGGIRNKIQEDIAGEDHFSTVLLQADSVSQGAMPSLIGIGDGYPTVFSGRRAFSDAQIDQPNTLLKRTINDRVVYTGANWNIGDQIRIQPVSYSVGPIITYPTGTTVPSVNGAWSNGAQLRDATDYVRNTDSSGGWVISIPSGSTLIGNSNPVTFDYTVHYPSGTGIGYGLSKLPEKFFEFQRIDSTCSYALTADGVPVRNAPPVILGADRTYNDWVFNKGASEAALYDFGHQMVHHIPGIGLSQITFPRNVNGYTVLGVVAVDVDGTAKNILDSTRDANNYTVNFSLPAASTGSDIAVTLYTGGKFFQGNKQGHAIVDTFEMRELIPVETPNGVITTFHVDTTTQEIIALASSRDLNGTQTVYINGHQQLAGTINTSNTGLPTDSTKSSAVINFVTAPLTGSVIEVPALTKSAIQNFETYTFLYSTVPYQGLLDSTTAFGTVVYEGKSLITTAGCGAITDYSYNGGTASFHQDSSIVNGFGNTRWLSSAKAGYFISKDASASKQYLIKQVYNDNTLFMTEAWKLGDGTSAYHITGKDMPATPSNIVDRLPVLSNVEDAECLSDNISTAVTDKYPTLETRKISAPRDILGKGPITIGVNNADRGMSGVRDSQSNAIGLKFEKLDSTGNFQKTYQSYIVDVESNLYLMVVGSESDNTSATRYFDPLIGADTVDIFEIPGRPLSIKRAL
jgi:hypothetical protein